MESSLPFYNFDLALEATDAGYRARVLDSPGGQADSYFYLPFDDEELAAIAAWPAGDLGGLTPQEVGARLFDSIFTETVAEVFRTGLAKAGEDGLRINLRLNDTPELMPLPWELLYDSSQGRFLSLSERTPVNRYLALPIGAGEMAVEGPLHILAVLASPADHLPLLAIEEEWTRLEGALAEAVRAGQVVLSRLAEPGWDGLLNHLREETVHVLHFVGHGVYDPVDGGRLIFTDEAGNSQPISAQKLADLLHNETTLRLAVLNACEGAVTDTNNPFAGVAQALAQRGLPAVIAMQRVISDTAAIQFSGGFYAAFADGYPVDAALAHARLAIYGDNDVEWATPTLFLRAIDSAPPARVVQIAGVEIPYWMVGALAGVLLLIVGLVSYNVWQGRQANQNNQAVTGQLDIIQQQVLATDTPTPPPTVTPTPTPLRMPDGSFNIAVAPFAPQEGDDTINPSEALDLSKSVANFLDDQSDTLTQVLDKRVTVWGPDIGLSIVTKAEAATVATNLNADVLVYGFLRDGGNRKLDIQPQFYLSEQAARQAEELAGDYAMGSQIVYRPGASASIGDVNKTLSVRLKALVGLIRGLSYMTYGDAEGYRLATETFQEVVDTSEWANADDGTGQEILYLFLGNGYLQQAFLTEDRTEERAELLSQAQATFEQAIALNPAYARSYNGLGSTLFQQARAEQSLDGCLARLDAAESAYETAIAQRPEDKPASGQVDFRAGFGLGQVNYWRGFCLLRERETLSEEAAEREILYEEAIAAWEKSYSYFQATVDAYAEMEDPIDHLTDVVGYAWLNMGNMDFTSGFHAQSSQDEAAIVAGQQRFTVAVTDFENAFEHFHRTNTQDGQTAIGHNFHVYVAALCADNRTGDALATLDEYANSQDDPEAVAAEIASQIYPDLWAYCVQTGQN